MDNGLKGIEHVSGNSIAGGSTIYGNLTIDGGLVVNTISVVGGDVIELYATDTGVGNVEVASIESGADPFFGIGVNGSVLKGTNGGLLGFFGATPVGEQLKANHNNWAAIGDVVNALVNLGLLDQA